MSETEAQAAMEAVLSEHATVNSTAGWAGSPNPSNWRNIRRVCRCGEVIGWPERRESGALSGRPFDAPHRAHIAAVLVAGTDTVRVEGIEPPTTAL